MGVMDNVAYKQPKFDLLGIVEPKVFNLPNIKSPLPWLNTSISLRQDIRRLIPYAKSIVMVGLIYGRRVNKFRLNKNYLIIADYAALRDYHRVLRHKLNSLALMIQENLSTLREYSDKKETSLVSNFNGIQHDGGNSSFDFKYRVFADSFPIYEKGYALSALGGTFGKNNLYQSFLGSKVVLGGLITNLSIDILRLLLEHIHAENSLLYTDIYKKHRAYHVYKKRHALLDKQYSQNLCSKCTACFNSCPTGALQPGKSFNATKCISYLTIEAKGFIPDFLQSKMQNWLFGCDVCQDSCPFNAKYQVYLTRKQLELRFGKVIPNVFYWRSLRRFSYHGFYKYFAGTPIIRMKYKRFRQRISWYVKHILGVNS